jgi:hypothetical protein
VFRAKHGPRGYTSYSSYKDWLRDEFAFRCVYCLVREKWFPSGDAAFAVEHIAPQGVVASAHLSTNYDNLVYACHTCNSRKGTNLTLNPRLNPFGTHLVVDNSGHISGITPAGKKLILQLGLEDQQLTHIRSHYLHIYNTYQNLDKQNDPFVQHQYLEAFSFPRSVPDLKAKRPPRNVRPKRVDGCYFQRFRGRLLTSTYF